MKLSKVLSLVLAIAMLISVPVFAGTYTDVKEDATYFEAVEALSALNIIKGYEEGDFKPEGKITRAEFATIVMRLMGSTAETTKTSTIFTDVTAEHWASGSISEAYGAGIVNGVDAKTFAPDAEVTYEQAIKMLVCSMGYQKKAESMVTKGTNPFPTGYNMIASQKKITEGTQKGEGGANRATVARLAYNALTVNLMDQTSFGTDVQYAELKDQSILYTKLDAIKVEAKITEVNLDPTVKDIKLNVTKYDDVARENKYGTKDGNAINTVDKGTVNLAGLQGLSVNALIDISESGSPVLIAVFPKSGKNQELAIEPSLFAGMKGTTIQYYKDADATTLNTSSKIQTEGFSIYVNSKKVDGEISKYAVQNGIGGPVDSNDKMYRFVDTDNNGYYDTLFVDNSASFVVGKINAADFEVYRDTASSIFNSSITCNATKTDYEFSPLDLDVTGDDVTYDLSDSEGKALKFEDIKVGDILTVAQTVDGSNKYYDITVSTTSTVEGTVSELSQKKTKGDNSQYITYYKIDGKEYRLNKGNDDKKIEAGTTGTFKITADGKIIAYELDSTMKNFAAAVKVAENTGGFSNGSQAQLVTTKGEIITVDFATKYTLNGTAYEDTASNVTANVKAINAAVSGKIVVYELNNQKQIKKLFVDDAGMRMVDADYRVTVADGIQDTADDLEYKAGTNKLGSTYLTKDTAFVAIKNYRDKSTKNAYSVTSESALTDEAKNDAFVVYDADKTAIVVLFTNFTSKPAGDSLPMFVTGTSTTSVDGSSRKRVTGFVEGKEVSYNLADDDNLTFFNMAGVQDKAIMDNQGKAPAFNNQKDITANDAIQFVLNGNEEIVSYRHLAKCNGNTMYVLRSTGKVDPDSKTTTPAELVSYNLSDREGAAETIIKSGNVNPDFNGTVVPSDVTTRVGYATGGRVFKISNRSVELFDTKDNTATTAVDAIKKTADVTFNANLPVYILGSSYTKVKSGSMDSIKTFNTFGAKLTVETEVNGAIAKADDIVYVYRYDGDAIFTMVIDTESNNYK